MKSGSARLIQPQVDHWISTELEFAAESPQCDRLAAVSDLDWRPSSKSRVKAETMMVLKPYLLPQFFLMNYVQTA